MRNAGSRTKAGTAKTEAETESGAATSASSSVDELLPSRLREWKETAIRQTSANPARTLALAAGAGYLLGGGLFSALTARILATGVKLGLRFALLPFVSHSVVALAEGLLTQGSAEGQKEGQPLDVDDIDAERNAGSQTRSQNATTRQADQKETHS